MKQCTRCDLFKPESEFYQNRGRLNSVCKVCKCEVQRAYARENAEKIQTYRSDNRERRNQQRRDWYRRLKLEAIMAYGGKCACCGEAEYAFLVFDHVEGGGMRQRIEEYGGERGRSGGHRFLMWLRDHDYPSKIQVLCANCNMAKYFTEGGCPHARS